MTGSATIAANASPPAAPPAPPPPPAAPPAPPPPPAPTNTDDAWRTSLAGDNAERLEALKGFENQDALFARLTAQPAQPSWEDFKKSMAGDDADAQAFLNKYSDPAQAFKAWKSAVSKLSEGGRVKVPGENATAEELAEFNKAIGLPEKVEDYKITAKVDGYEVSDVDKTALTDITAKVHDALAKGAKPNDIVNLAHQTYLDIAAQNLIAVEERAADLAVEGEAENRKLWGDDKYKPNIQLALAAAQQFFPSQDTAEFEKFMGLKLETGHALFDHPIIQRMFLQIGKAAGVGEDPFFLATQTNNPAGFDIDKRLGEIRSMRNGNADQRKQYADLSKPGGELEKLLAAKARQSAPGA